MTRTEKIESALALAFPSSLIELADESHLHAGHAGAATGLGHFRVRIASESFAGQSLLTRHRAVYAAVDSLMKTDIHALAIEAVAPT